MKHIAGRVPLGVPDAPLGGSLKTYHADLLNKNYTAPDGRKPASRATANLFSSEIRNDPRGRHMVALDLDVAAQLYPSTKPGHHHLYIEKPMSWDRYSLLLMVMVECGLVEEGYYRAAIARGATFLRAPWVPKTVLGGNPRPKRYPAPAPVAAVF